jgi:hypothetical protein
VLLRYTDYQGNLSMVRVSPTSAAADGTRATLVLPANVNGAFALQVFGSSSQPLLQIVPTLHAFTENGSLALLGSGFVEGASSFNLPGATLADTAVNAGADITYGYDERNVYGENNLANIPLANTPRYGLGNASVTTAGGTSAALALNVVRPGGTVATGYLTDVAVDRTTGATWVLDNDAPGHLLRIDPATGAIAQSITLTTAMGPYNATYGYGGLQVMPAAFSLGGVNVPAGSLLLLNGYGNNHATALNPATGAIVAQLDLAGSYLTSGVFDAASGRIFATTQDNKLSEFNAATGALVQAFDLPVTVNGHTGMAIDPAGAGLWIGSAGSGTSVVLVNRQGVEQRRMDLASQGLTGGEISGLAFMADGTLRVSSTQGTVYQVTLAAAPAVQPATLSAITGTATDGVPAQAGVASAHVGQLVTLTGTHFNAGTRVLFATRNADGSAGQFLVTPLAINDAGTQLQVLVPDLATTGNVRVQQGEALSAGVRLQIVPTLTGIDGRASENAQFTLSGSGFMDGGILLTVGGVAFTDPSGVVGLDISGTRNGTLTAVAPRTLDGPIRVTTEGGYAQITPQFGAQPLSLFTAIVATSTAAVPTNGALPSAITAQTIVLQGQGFTNNTLVQFQGRDDTGASGTLTRTGTASSDGRTLSVLVPAMATTGNVTVLGSGTSIALQVVPLVRSVGGTVAPGNTIVLEGIGLSAADLAITVGGQAVSSYTLRTVVDGTGSTRDLQLITLTVPAGAVGREISVRTSGGQAAIRTGATIANLGTQTPVAEPSDTQAGAASLGLLRDQRLVINASVGDGAQGQRDVDLYNVTLGARVMLSLNMATATYGHVRIFDAAGNQMATRAFNPNDTGLLEFSAPTAGTYTIGVSGWGNTTYNPATAGSGTASPYTGAYSLTVEAQSLGSVRLSAVQATASSGAAGNTSVPSAQPGQSITLSGAGLLASDRLVFLVADAAGNLDELVVTPSAVDLAAQTITVTVPDAAMTGRVRLERDTHGLLLQILPRVTDVQVQSVSGDGTTAVVVLSGFGFLDGGDSLYRFGSETVRDASSTSGPQVAGRNDAVLNRFIANGQVTITVPLTDGVFGGISVQTAGGTSALYSVNLAGITSVAASGTPANAAQASANAGQTITLNGSGLTTTTDVLVRYTDTGGSLAMVRVSPATAAADGTSATLVLPGQVNGAHWLQVFGSSSQALLQIVPTLHAVTENGTLALQGSGFVEGGISFNLPGATWADTATNAGADITYGNSQGGIYTENNLVNIAAAQTPHYGLGSATVTTAGGTSAALSLNFLRPGSATVPTGYLTDVAVDRTTGATWVLDNDAPGHLLRIDPATGAIAQSITLTTAMGPYNASYGYGGLQIAPSAFTLGTVVVPAGSLLLFNGYGNNHATALNPATGAIVAQLDLAGSYLTAGVFDASSGLIFATTNDDKLTTFNATTGAVVQGFDLLFSVTSHTGMAIDPAGAGLWIGSAGSGTSVVLVNRLGVEQRRVDLASQGITSGEISGLAFMADGTLLVSSTQGTVYRVTV